MTERPRPDDLERALDALRPAPPPDDLMARLRASRPGVRTSSAPRTPATALSARGRWPRWLSLAAVLLALATLAGLKWGARPAPSGASMAESGPAAVPALAPAPAQATVTPVALAAAPPVFLPVETKWHLVSLQPVPAIQRPDEAPRRLLRLVVVDETTAVGAETDAALHFRRAREVYLPITNPVY
jgi:hypothetical protein